MKKKLLTILTLLLGLILQILSVRKWYNDVTDYHNTIENYGTTYLAAMVDLKVALCILIIILIEVWLIYKINTHCK